MINTCEICVCSSYIHPRSGQVSSTWTQYRLHHRLSVTSTWRNGRFKHRTTDSGDRVALEARTVRPPTH